ncbi:hypothetical protein VOLCADRAFT_96131 [Volvox carteri f. nagariensis]|uniref:Major facilitator superfamily (MFS) profile domain-containing protein n=1 Tax=Volvox carteri f. nagariensis TaxID=3068 RepID=D8U9A7_VOLCA|nr:uncharacterized protein VOLCADRAFT_96131 [Volvox carteri f. nagariensis]EFJ43773.1 hypothetical protein VOLCADRAFT_96131 [Volvox carteri f. nagariensis]|eukprot:XP_002955254.1 hypothetical protein VOLCADRAFT_96131 [Volvox carteri f. nagariensis]
MAAYTASYPRRSAVLSSYSGTFRCGWRSLGGASSLVVHASHNHKPDPSRSHHQHARNQQHHAHQTHHSQTFHASGHTVKISRPRRTSLRQPHNGNGVAVAVPNTPPPPHLSPSSPSSSSSDPSNSLSSVSTTTTRFWGWWDALPSRYRIILGTAVSFVICNLDKVNLSVCIIPMARDYGWSPTTVGLVQSAFFWGYMMCQLPGGYFNSKLGGRRILPAGVLLYSAATGIVPAVAATVPGLCLSRAVVGFGQATAPSAATDIVARAVPPGERARAVTFIFSGFHVGSILGLLAAPWLIAHSGWRSVFITFGALGLVWWLWFEQGIMSRIAATEPDFANRLITDSRTLSAAAPSGAAAAVAATVEPPPLPWRAFLRSTPMRALAYTHFANNWFHYTMLAWLPTYFVDTLSVDLLHASQTALLPPLAGIAAGAAAGAAADALISRGMAVPTVRKLMQNIAFLLPTVLLVAACTPEIADNSGATVAAITVALGVSSCSLAGLFCTHQDMSPKYAPILLGLTNTTAAIPGVLGVASVGYLFEHTESWEVALFLPSAFFMVTAAAAYTIWGRNEPIDFDAADNSPFRFESRLQSLSRSVMQVLHRDRNRGLGLGSGSSEDALLPVATAWRRLRGLFSGLISTGDSISGRERRSDSDGRGSKEDVEMVESQSKQHRE